MCFSGKREAKGRRHPRYREKKKTEEKEEGKGSLGNREGGEGRNSLKTQQK